MPNESKTCKLCNKSISNLEVSKFGGLCRNCINDIPEVRQAKNEMRLKNIIKFCSTQEPIVVPKDNGDPLFACYLPKMMRVEDNLQVHINFGEGRIQTKENMIGIGGFFYDTDFFFETTPEMMMKAVNWFSGRIGIGIDDDFWYNMEMDVVRDFFDNNWDLLNNQMNNTFTVEILSLVWDLFRLDNMGVDIQPKISEIHHQMKGRLKNYERLATDPKFSQDYRFSREAIRQITDLRIFLAHLSSESRFAVLAKIYGFSVKFSDHPDIIINGRNVEVKKPTERYITPKRLHATTVITNGSTEIENISNHVDAGFKQNNGETDIVAIEVNHLDDRRITGFKTDWRKQASLKSVLTLALGFTTKDIVILFMQGNGGYLGKMAKCKRLLTPKTP